MRLAAGDDTDSKKQTSTDYTDYTDKGWAKEAYLDGKKIGDVSSETAVLESV